MDISRRTAFVALAVTLLLGSVVGASVGTLVVPRTPSTLSNPDVGGDYELDTFDSPAEFSAYLQASSASSYSGGVYYDAGGDAVAVGAPEADGAVTTKSGASDSVSGSEVSRYSETNVQEVGIDEPDVLKTNGQTFYYAPSFPYGIMPTEPGDAKPVPESARTRVVDASTPASPRLVANLNASGDLLLSGDTLLVLSGDRVRSFDVSNPDQPRERWSKSLTGYVVTARLMNGTAYLVVRDRVQYADPCPVRPLEDVVVRCSEIHHPTVPVRADSTTTVVALDPETGGVKDSASFVSSWSASVYMSENAIYVTHTLSAPRGAFYLSFLLSEERSRLDDRSVARLERLQEYDLSDRAVQVESQAIVSDWILTLDADERAEAYRALSDDYMAYVDDHKRELERTGIVRVDVADDGRSLSVAATGEVPGRPLDQFSMDEYDGHLRIATTVNPLWSGTSENDLYVLDEDLDVTGSVQGMGVNERIYSVRFIGERGYVVTFRQIDPFHVLDLSDPAHPTLEGELKLPGFSSYLHPVGEDLILGIGEENRSVKAVLFDVSDPASPAVASEVKLDEGWSEIRATHHAFLQDPKHEVVFVPGQTGGHVISYADGDLRAVTTVELDRPARRAAYVDDYLYVFSDGGVVVLDESSWDQVATLSFDA